MEQSESPVMRAKKDLMVKNLMPGLVERGKIKIGMKGEWRESQSSGKKFQLPTKLNHFVITTMERGADNNFNRDEVLHQALGEKPVSIPIRLLYDAIELNFQTRYSCYRGTTLLCFGNGEKGNPMKDTAGTRGECPCPCNHQDPKYTGADKCKINGTLSVMIDQAGSVGGVWKFRTTSYNSVVGILSSLVLIKRISGGALAGIPLDLTIQPKTVANPLDGKMQTIYVVGIEFRGSVKQLQDAGYTIALEYKKHDLRIGHLEGEARRLLAVDAAAFNESPEDIEKEFYSPEAREAELKAARDAGAPPDLFPPGDEKAPSETQPAAQPEKKDPPAPEKKEPPAAGDPPPAGGKNPRGRPPKPRAAGAPPAQPPAPPLEKPPQAPAQKEKDAPPLAGPDFSGLKEPPQKVIKGNFDQKAPPAGAPPAQPEKKEPPAGGPGTAKAPQDPGQSSLDLF